MNLVTENLISRETFEVINISPVNSSQYYSNKYLVVEVEGGASQSLSYPGIRLDQVFLGAGSEVIGASIPLKQGKQLIELLSLGVYYLRLTAGGAIPKAVVKVWENTGNIYNYFSAGEESPGGLGNDGLSAYQIAVINGFEGTQLEWLESLKGEPGEPGEAAAGGSLTLDLIPEPPAPEPDKLIVYASALDGLIYKKNSAGIVEAIGVGGGGGGGSISDIWLYGGF